MLRNKVIKPINIKNLFLIPLLTLGIHSQLSALDPSLGLRDYLEKSWTRQDGLPQNTILSIAQSSDDFLWLGTPSALLRFDGYRFKQYTLPGLPAFANIRITVLHEDLFGRLWIGTDGAGLACLQEQGKWQIFSTRDGLSNDHIRSITSDWQGNIWIGTDYGLNRFNRDGFRQYTPRDGLYDNIVTALATDSRDFLWIGTLRGGLMQFQNGMIIGYGYREGLEDEAILSLLADRLNNIWIGTLHGLYVMNGGQGRIQFIQGSKYTPVTSLVEDQAGTVWAGTMADGLKKVTGSRFTGVPVTSGFPSDYIQTLFCDKDDNLWIGSDANGLFRLRNPSVHNLGIRNGLPDEAATTVLQDREGDLWVGTATGGLFRLRKNRVMDTWNAGRGLSSNQITALLEGRSGAIWIGTRDHGLNSLRNGLIKKYGRKEGLSSLTITSLLEDSSGTLWIGTDRGLNRMVNGNTHVIKPVGPVFHYINGLLQGGKGQLYAGTREGLFIYQDKSFRRDIYGDSAEIPDILSLYKDRQDRLWMGTNGSGLGCLQGNSLRFWTTANGLPDNHIFSICTDDSGNLWLSSYNGVFQINRSELDSISIRPERFLIPTWFDENEGMTSGRCSSGGNPAVWKGNDSRLYYPTAAGISIFNPIETDIPQKSPRVIIESIVAEGRPVNLDDQLIFTYPLKHLSIIFTAADFVTPLKLNFFYRLGNADVGWTRVTASDVRQADYYDLQPGIYRFYLKTVAGGDSWNQPEAILEFTVRLPFYRQSVFLTISLLLILTAASMPFYLRQRRIRRKKLDKYKTSTLDVERAESTVSQLLILLEKDKVFLEPRLNLKSLAKMLRIHPNHLSRIINEKFAMSYNDFINKWRIEEAKSLLARDKSKNILEILYETGFYSKSVFNTAFRKFTGMTPSQYRNRHSK